MPAPDRALVEAAAYEAGAIARRFFDGDNKNWKKKDGTPVSEADLAVDNFLKERLRKARPDYGWLSEESEDDAARLAAKRVFVVDPIDGTAAILNGEPHFTVCIAVVEDHRTLAAAVYNPLLDEMYTAGEGLGATLNRRTIRVGEPDRLEGCRILVRPKLTAHARWAADPWPPMHEEDRCSAAYRLVLVAAGMFDATISLSSKCDWDLAAADLILREAGGALTTHDGTVPGYNFADVKKPSAIAAGPKLLPLLLKKLQSFTPRSGAR